jgi:hypothetical protein
MRRTTVPTKSNAARRKGDVEEDEDDDEDEGAPRKMQDRDGNGEVGERANVTFTEA